MRHIDRVLAAAKDHYAAEEARLVEHRISKADRPFVEKELRILAISLSRVGLALEEES